jgi:hypothetical protein
VYSITRLWLDKPPRSHTSNKTWSRNRNNYKYLKNITGYNISEWPIAKTTRTLQALEYMLSQLKMTLAFPQPPKI